MRYDYRIGDLKHQTMATDCWYTAMATLVSWREGCKMKPSGRATLTHRKYKFGPLTIPFIGRGLHFGSHSGRRILEENDLIDVSEELPQLTMEEFAEADGRDDCCHSIKSPI